MLEYEQYSVYKIQQPVFTPQITVGIFTVLSQLQKLPVKWLTFAQPTCDCYV